MIRLISTANLELVTAQNGAYVVVSYSSDTGTGYPGSLETYSITSATTTVIGTAPAGATVKDIDFLTVKNTYAGAHTITLQVDVSSTNYPMLTIILQENETLEYTHGSGWKTLNADGSVKTTVQLSYSTVISALGFTPEDVANKSIDGTFAANSDTLYPSQKATKTYVDNVAGGSSIDFFLSDTVSDIGTYYTMLNNPSGDAESTVSASITANPTSIKKFATISTEPNITTLVAGVYTFHIHAAQTAGTKTSKVYALFYTRTSGGTETLRATSELSSVLSGANTSYDLHFLITTDIPINATDRIVIEVLGTPIGAGTDPTVVLYMEGTNATRIEFRTTSAASDSRYLVKNGLVGGQIAIGGTGAGDDLLFQSTSDATKGYVGIGSLTTGFIYDEVNNYFGFGVVPTYFMHFLMPATSNYYIDGRTNPRTSTLGVVRIDHTAGITGTRPINIDVICAGFGDTHAVNVDFHATGIVAGQDNHIYDVHVDTSNSTGGEVAGLSVGKSGTGTVTVKALEAYHGVMPIEQRAGSISTIEQAWAYTGVYTDVTTAFGSAATDVQIFVSNSDYVYVGMATTFDDIEVILAIVASGAGVKPVFQYSIGGGSWTTFTPVDGTNGFRANGNISWALPLTGWTTDAVNGVTKYWVRIQRTQNTLATPPTEDTIKVFTSTFYEWDELGNLAINKITQSLGNSLAANTVGQTITLGNTQTNAVVGSLVALGSSAIAHSGYKVTGSNAAAGANAFEANMQTGYTGDLFHGLVNSGDVFRVTYTGAITGASLNVGTGTLTAGAGTCSGNLTVGGSDTNHYMFLYGIGSGTDGGSALLVGLVGTTIIGIGNKSAVLGGAYDATPLIYANATITTNQSLAVNGAISATSNILITGAGLIGYTTGSGGTVTQITSRTTGVTINKSNGEITLVSAAGTASWQSFTVTNSLVAANSFPDVCQVSGTDKYMIHRTNVQAGSFEITFATTGGTTTEQPVFRFEIHSGATA